MKRTAKRRPGERSQFFRPWILAGTLAALASIAPLARAEEVTNKDCIDCHGLAAASDADHAPIVSEKDYATSGHSDLDCTHCHADATEIPHADKLAKVSLDACTDCHDDEVTAYKEGNHSHARERGVQASPDCSGCHGDLHKVVGSDGDRTRERSEALAKVCARCHADPELASQLHLSVVKPVDAYLMSAHARAVREGKHGAVCSDCHEPHRTLPPNDPKSSIWPANVPETCGACHKEILEKYQRSVHGQALARGMRDAPTCTSCHGEHRILSHSDVDSPVFATNVPSETCGRCHADNRFIERHGLSGQNFDAFQDSFHGLALRAGEVEAATCSSCHGVHDVLPSSDARSSVHPDNLAKTCGQCHPGAGQRLAIGPVHVTETQQMTAIEFWIRRIYWWVIVVVIGGMLLHNAADLWRKAHQERHAAAPSIPARIRMPKTLRLQHRLVMVSFTVLAFTGFAVKYPESWWAAPFLHLEKLYAFRGFTHRVAAVVMMTALAWHVGALVFSRRARAQMRGMWWGRLDASHFVQMMRHYAGRRADRPRSGRFSYIEKAEYWAFLWGSLVMAGTGLPLWFADFTLRYVPKSVTDIATAIHLYEAILATLAIAVWHFYWVIFDPDVYPMDTAWWTGHAPPARDEERDDEGCDPE